MNKKVLLTGFSSGMGKCIGEILERNNFDIIRLKSRFEDIKSLEIEVKNLLKDNDIDILINCAGIGKFTPHESLNISNIQDVININLVAPIVLSNLLLRSLKKTKGHIINITSIEATRHSKFSALYTATKSGLRDFGLCLFEEVRSAGVKVTSLNPDITKTHFFDKLQFEPSNDKDTFLLPQTVARTILNIINFDGVITDVTMRSQKFNINKKNQK
jgi:short-subunit dehydrogenase